MRTTLTLVLIFCASCGSSRSRGPQMWVVPAPIAVGARVDAVAIACHDEFDLGAALLASVGTGLIAGLGRFDALLGLPAAWSAQCRPLEVTVEQVTLRGDAFSLQSPNGAPVTTLLAERVGTATLTLEGQAGGEHFSLSHTFEARTANHIDFVSACAHRSLVKRGASFSATARLFDGDTGLAGYGYLPLDEEGLTRVTTEPLVYVVDPHADIARLRSSIDPAFAIDFTVVDDAQFDTLSLYVMPPEQGLYVSQLQHVRLSASLEQRSMCAGTINANVFIDTPDVCNTLTAAPSQADADFYVRALASGQCRGRVSLEGSTVGAPFEFTVHQGWHTLPIADGFRAQAVWGTSPSDLFVGGSFDNAAVIEHFDGAAWSRQVLATGTDISQVVGASATHVLALTGSGVLFAFDGTQWAALRSESQAKAFSVSTSGATDIWVLTSASLEHFDGQSWVVVTPPTRFSALSTSGPGNAWAIAQRDLFHWNGSVWTNETPKGQTISLLAVASTANSVWVVGNGGGLRFDGTRWSDWSASTPSCMQAISVLDESTTFAANCNGSLAPVVMQSASMPYPQTLTAPFPNDSLSTLWVHTAHDVFGIGGGGLYRWQW